MYQQPIPLMKDASAVLNLKTKDFLLETLDANTGFQYLRAFTLYGGELVGNLRDSDPDSICSDSKLKIYVGMFQFR